MGGRKLQKRYTCKEYLDHFKIFISRNDPKNNM